MGSLLDAVKRRLRPLFQSRDDRRADLVGPPGCWEMKRQFQIDFLKRFGLEPQHYLLDIGCGVLRGGIPLIEYLEPAHYYGIEVQKKSLEEGEQALVEADLTEKQPNLTWAPTMEGLNLDRKFDYVWAFAVLHHMYDDILFTAIDFAQRHLAPGGVFYANVNIGERYDGEWQGFPGVKRPLEFYEEEFGKRGFTFTDVGSLKELGHVSGRQGDQSRMLKIVFA
jgi:SAM-dependent methyltransferase